MVGARLRGIIDELIATGFPDQVAERIAKGDLDMRPEAISERQQDLFPTTAFHGGGDDIRVVDPNRITNGKTANTGFFMSDSPVVAASYADRAGNIMPLAVNTRGFDVVNAGGNEWNQIINPDYFLAGERKATRGDLPGYRGTLGAERDVFDLDVVRNFDTDELARTARRFKSPGLIVKDVQDIGPNYKAFDPAFEAMTGLKFGDEGYQEALDRFSADTIVTSDPTRVRSLFAAFDPEYKGSNILGGAATAAVGAGLLAAPEEAEAGPLSAAARAAQQGFTNKQYHASMQDFDRIVPGYDDGLFFTTPNPEFASNWAGKGKLQQREGELDFYDRYRPQKEKLYEEMGSPEFGTPEYDKFVELSREIYSQEQNAFKTIYPLLARTEKTFDPEKNFDDIADLFDESRLKAPFSSEYPTYADALKGGNYILYENPEVVRHLKNKGYDSMFLRESTGSKAAREAPYTTVAHFYPDRNIRSQFAEFAEGYTGPNILGGTAAGALGLTALMAPEEAEAGVLSNLIKAGYPEEVAQRIASGELPMDYASRMERALSQDHDIHEGLLHGSTHDITNFDASLTQQQNDLGQGIYLTDRPFDVNTNYAGEGPDLTNRIERLADELESTMESSWSWNADFWDKLPGGAQGKLADEIENLIEEGEYRAAAEKASKALSKGDNEGVVYPLTVSKAGIADSADSVPMPEYFDEAVEDLEFDANNLTDEQYDEVMDRVYELEADDIESPIAKAINIAAQYGADFPAYNIEPGMTTFADMHRYFQMTEAYDDAGEVVGGGQMMNEWLRDLGYTGYVDRTTPEKFSGMGAGVHTIVFPGEEKNIRSFLSAAYDPKYTGPNILGGSAAAATGLGLLGMPQESVADTAARLRAESNTSGAYAPRSGLLQNVTMAARDLERRLEGSPASLLFPSGYIQHLEEFNRPYERSTYTGALLGALDFL